MNDQLLSEAFNDCVNRMQQGEPIEDCLRRYPYITGELRPMLETARLVQFAAVPYTE